jgi:hypothetical protein
MWKCNEKSSRKGSYERQFVILPGTLKQPADNIMILHTLSSSDSGHTTDPSLNLRSPLPFQTLLMSKHILEDDVNATLILYIS